MIGRLLLTALWLAIGVLVVFGLYWLLLNTPESNVATLIASLVLVLLMTMVSALFVNISLRIAGGTHIRESLSAAARSVHWVLVVAAPAALVWWAVLRLDRWLVDHSGEINAWLIARFGWADVGALFRAELWLSRWFRWSLIPLLALALLGALLDGGFSGAFARWRRALTWRSLAAAALSFIVLIALPLPLIDWRPSLPPTWVQPATAAARLAIVAAMWITGAALLVLLARPQPSISAGAGAHD
jgi:hypothetical protein